jgi:hypothetical protein
MWTIRMKGSLGEPALIAAVRKSRQAVGVAAFDPR